jgi:hypothetical protein
MDNSRHMLEQPFMRAIANKHHILVGLAVGSQIRPAFGHDGTETVNLYSLHDYLGDPLWIVKYNATESDVYRWRSTLDEISKFRRWLVIRWISEEEAADVNVGWPLYWFRHKRRRPAVCEGDLECIRKTWAIEHGYLLEIECGTP